MSMKWYLTVVVIRISLMITTEKAMAPHSSVLAWKIPWTEEPVGCLSDFTFTFHFHALEKEMAPHSSVRAWRIPEMGEPGGLLWGRTESDTTQAT